MNNHTKTIIDIYKTERDKYKTFTNKINGLTIDLLDRYKINYHKIESRTKEISSLEKKLNVKERKYKKLNEITDLTAIRIISFFEDDVDKVANVIEKEFEKDDKNSIDKRKIELDRFGYKSLHYVVRLNKDRKKLPEYNRFKDIFFEIQIRSILQHAWAEIEHDLGYKNELSVPDSLKRNFSRVAALLEVSDLEFVRIKNELKTYEEEIKNKIKSDPQDVEINLISLKSFILNNNVVTDVDKELCLSSGSKLAKIMSDISLERLIKKLYFVGIKTVDEARSTLNEKRKDVIRFSKEWIKLKGMLMGAGISLFYLCYILVGEKNDLEYAKKYIIEEFKEKNEDDINRFANKIINTYKKINK